LYFVRKYNKYNKLYVVNRRAKTDPALAHDADVGSIRTTLGAVLDSLC